MSTSMNTIGTASGPLRRSLHGRPLHGRTATPMLAGSAPASAEAVPSPPPGDGLRTAPLQVLR
jgi:hypothetical protein